MNDVVIKDKEARVEICAKYLELLLKAPQIASKLLYIMLMLTFLIDNEGVSGN